MDDRDKFDFTVCNPPFFSSLDQTAQNESRVCNATANELVCEGGELTFITNMIQQSVKRKHQIR